MGTTGQSITLANSIIGVGILAMPFCFQQCGVLLAGLILLTMGLISRLCCYFLLKSAMISRRRNFEFLAFHVFGSAGKLAVELGIIGFLMGTCIAYFVVVGDLGPQIVSKMFNINQSDILRTSIMVIVSLVCVLPLGLLRNVDSLSNVSAATIGFYFCLVIKVIAEATSQLPSGEWRRRMELWRPAGLLQCVPIFSMALFCQTQLFEIFEPLPSLSLEKMNVVTKNAINICTGVYFTLGVFGYIAFCSHQISGNILMSLSPTMASDVIKLGFVMSLAFSFPLIIFPCRASLYSFLYKKVHSSQHDHIINHSIPETTFRCITVAIIAVSLCISLLIPDIELVLGLVGSTIGVLVCVVFPTACFLHLTTKNTNERVLAKAVLILGLIIMVLGTYANLQAAEDKLDKYDERFITQERIDKIVEDFFEKRGEKNGEPYIKQLPKKDPVKLESHNPSNTIIKDSEIQPPNPVPPESNSNEVKSPDTVENNKLNDVLLPEKVKEDAAADKISESHPKNVNAKSEFEAVHLSITNNKEPKTSNGETKIDKPEEKPINDEKVKLMKQQKLIETMKQHGEEQKELMQEQKEIMAEIIKNKKEEKPKAEPSAETAKINPSKKPINIDVKPQNLMETIKQHGEEQKEILNEIIKTKKEFDQNKEVNSDEAKKIAVESIKQIANMAIKSIGGVTEKPAQIDEDKKVERLNKLRNEAVQEIAKKAVETIEAIKEIKDNPETLKVENNANLKPKEAIDQASVLKPPQPIIQYVNNPVKLQYENKPIINEPVALNVNKHSHSPDEPQSYKEGEDAQIKTENKLNQNIPIPLALKGLQEIAEKQAKEELANKLKNNPASYAKHQEDNKVVGMDVEVPMPRQKREVDYTKTNMKSYDKQIRESLINTISDSDILPKVDLNDAIVMPLDLHHVGRSLKSFDKEEDKK